MNNLQDILSTIPIFSFLGRNEITAVQSLFVESTHQRGVYICHEGEEGDTFHIILDGELEVVVGQGESARVVGILKKGDFFGEMALLQGGKRTASVVVSRRAHLVTLDRSSFNSLFLKKPERIEALGLVLLLALLLWRLVERALRVHVETTGSTLIGWDKKATQKPTAFMMMTKFAAVMVIKVGGQRQLAHPLSTVQQQYLLALNVPATYFTSPQSG